MASPHIAPTLSDSLTALGLDTDSLFFALNFDFTAPNTKKKSKLTRLKQNQGAIDIDIACALYDDDCTILDIVWFKQLRDQAESIRHQGDSLNGKDRGEQAMYDAPLDQEQIRLYMKKIPANVRHISLIATSYYGQPFNQVHAGEVHLSSDEGNRAFTLNLKQLPPDCHSLWVAHLRREVDDWYLTTQNLPLDDHDIPKAAQQIAHELARSLPAAPPQS